MLPSILRADSFGLFAYPLPSFFEKLQGELWHGFYMYIVPPGYTKVQPGSVEVMRAIATIAFLMACGFAELAHASIATPTCQQMQAAYDALTNSGPISATDGTLSIAVNALADNGLMPKDSTFVGPATRDNIAKHLQSLRPHDRLQWVGRQYGWLTTELLRNKCTGFKERHIELMERALPSNSCLAPGELPKILLDKPL